MNTMRFTIDGSHDLEAGLSQLCSQVLEGIQSIIPPKKLEAVVLGGGYGRGEGGVLRTAGGDQPYNDFEFYIFLRGNRLLNSRRYEPELVTLAGTLSTRASLHVEFKIDSLSRWRRSGVTMFSYDLVSAHRIIFGNATLFGSCRRHLDASRIPTAEATRLLFNRCTGLLLAREILERTTMTAEEADFIGRNLAKAKLALGDAVLTHFQRYHWSCLERQKRLEIFDSEETVPGLEQIKKYHSEGVAFKLHPFRVLKSAEAFSIEHLQIGSVAQQLWLWLESRRLNRGFASMNDYVFHSGAKCSLPNPGRNLLLNLRTFGFSCLLDPIAWRYPRERLFNSLPLLLWNGEVSTRPELTRHLQRQLRTEASDWVGLVSAYKEVWPSYG